MQSWVFAVPKASGWLGVPTQGPALPGLHLDRKESMFLAPAPESQDPSCRVLANPPSELPQSKLGSFRSKSLFLFQVQTSL